ncbi:MAG: amidophosphoribosyltransferase [Candidatus Diapherotrites archaeon]
MKSTPITFNTHPHEACGIAAVYLKKELSHYPPGGAAFFLQKMLQQLQHRGQLSAGISTYHEKRVPLIRTHKGNGLVHEVFSLGDTEKGKNTLTQNEGTIGIGHTRYSTSGSNTCDDAQPFERTHARMWKWFAYAFNGTITNAPHIREHLVKESYYFHGKSDTETLMHLIAHQLGSDEPRPIENAFHDLFEQAEGAYSLAFINAMGELVLARDPKGFKPLCYVDTPDFFLAASENCAILPFVPNGIHDIKPGEILRVHHNKLTHTRYMGTHEQSAHCMFEWVYFASAGSTLSTRPVYETRYQLGVQLAQNEKIKTNRTDYIVVNVPDTSKPAADGYAYTLNLPAKEGLLRNRYIGRTFIEGGEWQDKIKEKFTINASVLKGKKVILVEDSLVRGNTLRILAERIRKEGKALEVHARISCPPILHPCFYGIDMTTYKELAAVPYAQTITQEKEEIIHTIEKKLAHEIGVETLHYQTLKGLFTALQLDEEHLCTACLTGKYPTQTGEELRRITWEKYLHHADESRSYDG